MKTGEIYTYALSNPKAEFLCIEAPPFDGNVAHFNKIGKLVDECGELVFPTFNTEWELVPEQVTWQEALQAWIDGKEAYCTLNGDEKICLADSHYLRVYKGIRPISKDDLSRGKWYIK